MQIADYKSGGCHPHLTLTSHNGCCDSVGDNLAVDLDIVLRVAIACNVDEQNWQEYTL